MLHASEILNMYIIIIVKKLKKVFVLKISSVQEQVAVLGIRTKSVSVRFL